MAMVESARRLVAVDELAASLGAAPGQTVADALALNPELVLVDADPEEDRAALERLADWCERLSPAVAVDPPDGLFLDVAGCAHLWGGERAMAEMLLARLAAEGIPARVAIAPTFGAAWALARYGEEEVAIVPACPERSEGPRREPGSTPTRDSPESEPSTRSLASLGTTGEAIRGGGGFPSAAAILSPLPLDALRLEPQVSGRLRLFGLATIGDALALPRAALTRRVGETLALRLDQMLGRADEPLAFRRPPSPFLARRVFAEPISTSEDFLRVVSILAAELCGRLGEQGLGARGFEAVLHRVDGAAPRRAVALSLPARDPKRVAALLAPKLETLDPGFGVEVVALLAHGVEPVRGAQADLVEAARDARDADLAPLIDRLRNRLGPERVWRAAPHPSHVPERAVARVEALAPAAAESWPEGQPRPVRLFARPQPIEAIAPVPDDPPLMFRWRGRRRRVVRAEGPERIGAEWWRGSWAEMRGEGCVDRVRDYYRLEDETGARYWVFRTGLYDGPRAPKWWLHGVFA